MTYLATFNPDGSRITTYVSDIHSDIPSDAIEITEDDQNLYASNQYIRDMTTGKPIPITLTPAQIKEMNNAPILAQISALETKQARAVREVICGMTASQTYLTSLNDQITTLRASIQV